MLGNLRKKFVRIALKVNNWPFDCWSTIVLDAYKNVRAPAIAKEILTKNKQPTVETWTLLMLGPSTIIH